MNISRRASFASLTAAAAGLAACTQGEGDAGTAAPALSEATFAAWLDRYKVAWETRDPAAAGALFTEDATYHEMPFDPPKQGRAEVEAYWADVTAAQSDINFSYDVIACAGDCGVAHWRTTFNAGDAAVELDGVFVCTFTADGAAVSTLREWWHVQTS